MTCTNFSYRKILNVSVLTLTFSPFELGDPRIASVPVAIPNSTKKEKQIHAIVCTFALPVSLLSTAAKSPTLLLRISGSIVVDKYQQNLALPAENSSASSSIRRFNVSSAPRAAAMSLRGMVQISRSHS
ncbi:hypothetical protein Mapa_006471 [Marchantia paleacea]|nr:hypothetical protein Mapa_006471 [Marchantia paleacea]